MSSDDKNHIGNIFGNQGIITQGQTGNNYLGAIPRRLSDARAVALKKQLLNEFPRDKKMAVITVLGDTEAFQFATDILEFLKENNFNVEGVHQTVYMQPVKGIHRQDKPDAIELIIGSQ